MKNRYFRHPADSNPLIIQAPNLRKLYFSRCPKIAERAEAQVSEAGDAESAVRLIREHDFDVVITDLSLVGDGDKSGLDVVLQAAKSKDPFTQVIVVTSYATPEVSLEAIERGAYDFVDRDSMQINFKGVLRRKIIQAAEYGALRRDAARAA